MMMMMMVVGGSPIDSKQADGWYDDEQQKKERWWRDGDKHPSIYPSMELLFSSLVLSHEDRFLRGPDQF
jgi:hypothetical protein